MRFPAHVGTPPSHVSWPQREAKDPIMRSCECRRCEYRLRWISLWGHTAREECGGMWRVAGPPCGGLPSIARKIT
eukprot:8851714-Pyramimonas_sp.AAC.1